MLLCALCVVVFARVLLWCVLVYVFVVLCVVSGGVCLCGVSVCCV